MDIKNKQNDLPTSVGQSSKLDDGNNPKGLSTLKATRQTNEVPAGSQYLRGELMGRNK